jgi:hypothetical protein
MLSKDADVRGVHSHDHVIFMLIHTVLSVLQHRDSLLQSSLSLKCSRLCCSTQRACYCCFISLVYTNSAVLLLNALTDALHCALLHWIYYLNNNNRWRAAAVHVPRTSC